MCTMIGNYFCEISFLRELYIDVTIKETDKLKLVSFSYARKTNNR